METCPLGRSDRVAFLDVGEEIIKSTDTGGIIRKETAEDGIKRESLGMQHQ